MAMGEVLMRYRWSVITPIILAITGLVAASALTADIRYILVALMIIFIVIPGLLSLAYFYVALTPTAALCVLPQHLVVLPGRSITVIYEPAIKNGEIICPKTPKEIAWNEIKQWEHTGNHTLAITEKYTLIIPDNALPCLPDAIFDINS